MRRAEFDVGHIRLARDTDLIVVAPATADLMAKMAGGHADDLASAVLLATDKPILIAPAMNPRMWAAKATQRNLAAACGRWRALRRPQQRRDGGARRSRPRPHGGAAGNRGCRRGHDAPGSGRSPASAFWSRRARRTSRSTRCASSPIAPPASRGTRSRRAAAAAGADVVLVSGPVDLPDPPGLTVVKVETAKEMLAAVEKDAAGRRRHIRRRGCGLAGRASERQQDQETRRPAAAARTRRKSRHPGDCRPPQVRPSATRHRICGGDR